MGFPWRAISAFTFFILMGQAGQTSSYLPWYNTVADFQQTPLRGNGCNGVWVLYYSLPVELDSKTFASPSLGGYLRQFCSLRLGALWLLCFNGAGYKHSYLLTYPFITDRQRAWAGRWWCDGGLVVRASDLWSNRWRSPVGLSAVHCRVST